MKELVEVIINQIQMLCANYVMSCARLNASVKCQSHSSNFIDKNAYARFVKCFQTCLLFLNLHIEVKEMTLKFVLQS